MSPLVSASTRLRGDVVDCLKRCTFEYLIYDLGWRDPLEKSYRMQLRRAITVLKLHLLSTDWSQLQGGKYRIIEDCVRKVKAMLRYVDSASQALNRYGFLSTNPENHEVLTHFMAICMGLFADGHWVQFTDDGLSDDPQFYLRAFASEAAVMGLGMTNALHLSVEELDSSILEIPLKGHVQCWRLHYNLAKRNESYPSDFTRLFAYGENFLTVMDEHPSL